MCHRSNEKSSNLGEIAEVDEHIEKEDGGVAGKEETEKETGERKAEDREGIEREGESKVVETVVAVEKTAVEVEVHDVGKEETERKSGDATKTENKVDEGKATPNNNTSGNSIGKSIERTDSGPPTPEGDSNNTPTLAEGDNIDSFSSVKHLLS